MSSMSEALSPLPLSEDMDEPYRDANVKESLNPEEDEG